MAVDGFDRTERKARRRQLAVATLLICELCLLTIKAGALAAAGPQPVNPLDTSLPQGALKAVQASPDRFNAPVPLRFRLKGASFDRTAADVILTLNGVRVSSRHIKITAHQLSTDSRLADGANLVSLKAYDTIGRPLYYNYTIWCGNWTLRVDLVGPDGSPIRDVCTIVVTVPGDETVRQEQMTNRGSATFRNLPAHKLVIRVHAATGEEATSEAFGSAGAVQIQLPKSST